MENCLINDIKTEQLPLQKRLYNILGNEMEINGDKVNINDLVDILIQSKYGSITFYYDNLLNQIINNYKSCKVINKEKIKLCIDIMNNYYDGVIGINNFFNI